MRNYILEFTELGKDLTPVRKHFVDEGNMSIDAFKTIEKECKHIYNKPTSTLDPEILREIETLRIKIKQLSKSGCKNKKCKNN